jgi:hypothetical protein
MFIFNVTTHVEHSAETQWLEWMNNIHLPDMIKTGKFNKAILFRVITDQNEDQGGTSYAAQYHCNDRSKYEAYLKEDAPLLRKEALEKFGTSILSFRTELEQIIAL